MKSTPLNAGPPTLALARAVPTIPAPDALPGGAIYEPKWDGYRIVISSTEDATTLWSRQGKDLTHCFPDLAAAAEAEDHIPPGFLVDGEAVIWTEDRLDFEALQKRLTSSKKNLPALVDERPASFVAFDLLQAAGTDTRSLALRDRRELLEELASWWEPPLDLSPTTTDLAKATRWFDTLPPTGIEGLVIKGADQEYEGGERQWLKVKHRETFEIVCAAVIGPISRPEMVIAGLPLDGELRLVGHTSRLKAPSIKDACCPPDPCRTRSSMATSREVRSDRPIQQCLRHHRADSCAALWSWKYPPTLHSRAHHSDTPCAICVSVPSCIQTTSHSPPPAPCPQPLILGGTVTRMELTGTIRNAETAETSHITASGATYDDARAALDALVPEGAQLIALRTDRG